jgi:molecular chaperone DnaK (HSP70)
MDKSKLVYGIDLGTTYSYIAQANKFDQSTVLRSFEGDATTPSGIYLNGSEVIAGKDANAQSNCPEDKRTFITCPAYFGIKERMQTKQTGVAAGLNVLSVINGPTTAAISCGMRAQERKVVLVYDLGGGTFDVTIVCVDGGTIKVVATGGDHHFGGVDWDILMAEYVLGVFNEEHGTHYTLDEAFLKSSLLYEVEQKKKTLTAKPKVNISFTFKGASSRVEITREFFDLLTEPS